MKKTITLLTLCLIGSLSFAQQTPAIQWQKCLGGTGDDIAQSIQPTSDGGYIMAGTTSSTNGDVTGNHGYSDAWIMKLSAIGAIEWQKTLGGTNSDYANSIQPTSDGGYIMVGNSNSINGDVSGNLGGSDVWVVKLNSTGSVQWQKCLGGSSDDFAKCIQTTNDGGFIIAGYVYSNNGNVFGNHGSEDAWVVKISSTGSLQWQKCLGGAGSDYANSIQPTTDGGYILSGNTHSTDGDVLGNHGGVNDAWVVKLSNTGSIQWQKCLGGSIYEDLCSIQPTFDGGYIIAGFTYSTNGDVSGNHGAYDAWVVKLDNIGSIQWQKCLGGMVSDYAYCVKQTDDGGYILAGTTLSTGGDVTGNHGSRDEWVVKIAATGDLVWQKTIGGTSDDYGNSIQTTSDGGIIVAGYTYSTDGDVTGNHGLFDSWVVKLEPELSTTGFVKEAIMVYPNPAKTLLTLQNNLQTPFEKIVITDLTGKIVLTQTAPTSQVNVAALANGMYILTAFSGEEQWVSKFVKE